VQHQGEPGNAGASISTYEGTGTFWFWPSVPPEATQLRVTVGTLREAVWALIDIPGRQRAHGEMAQIRWQTRHRQVQKEPPLKLSHPGQRLNRGSDPMAQDMKRVSNSRKRLVIAIKDRTCRTDGRSRGCLNSRFIDVSDSPWVSCSGEGAVRVNLATMAALRP
jgi:hypothetical protein